jgi:maternal-effect protein exuperantia
MAPVGKTSSEGIPAGQYKVVTIALDLTGKKLIDEICHIAAYYQDPEIKTYSQYVMPVREVTHSAIRTHGIRILTSFG